MSKCYYVECRYAECHYTECRYAGCLVLFTIMLSVIMLNVKFYLQLFDKSRALKFLILSRLFCNCVTIIGINCPSVIMLNVVILNVVAPSWHPSPIKVDIGTNENICMTQHNLILVSFYSGKGNMIFFRRQ